MKLRALLAMPLLLGLPAAHAADLPVDRMEASTVRVVSKMADGYSTGSGFLVGDGTYVVTNHHVIADAQEILVLAKTFKKRVGRIVVDSPQKDLAVLQMEDGIGRPAVVLGLSAGVRKAQSVLAAGFPGAADNQGDSMDNFLEVKFSQGIISGYVRSPNGEALYQISAALNPGNSGGPLFDECGRVIGINVEKSLTQAVTVGPDGQPRTERVPLGEGIGWSIEADELARLLQAAGLETQVVSTSCVPGAPETTGTPAASPATETAATPPPPNPFTGRVILFSLAGVFAVGILVTLLVVFSGRGSNGARPSPHVVPPPVVPPPVFPPPVVPPPFIPPPLPEPEARHKLRGLAGTFTGVSFPLSREPITMGRNPLVSQIVFKDADGLISKRHCTVRVDRHQGGVVLEDCNSMNGTFLDGGERLKSGESRLIRTGGRFYLGSRDNLFQVD